MKRINNLYQKIISIENLTIADQKARKGKMKQYGVQLHIDCAAENLQKLHLMLKNKEYKTSEYSTFKVFEPKERDVYRLPYYPDRITHHAIMNVLEPIFVSVFSAFTYSCIKKRGIHAAARSVQKALKDVSGTQYCLKLDIVEPLKTCLMVYPCRCFSIAGNGWVFAKAACRYFQSRHKCL